VYLADELCVIASFPCVGYIGAYVVFTVLVSSMAPRVLNLSCCILLSEKVRTLLLLLGVCLVSFCFFRIFGAFGTL
jgi:hypothetical protein